MKRFLYILLLFGALYSAHYYSYWPFLSGKLRPLQIFREYEVWFYNQPISKLPPPDPYNSYYQPPPAPKPESLGIAFGMDECREKASWHARLNRKNEGTWDYECCEFTRTSNCARKLK